MSENNNKLYIFKLGSILFTICFIATLLLTLCNYITKDKISELELITANAAKSEVISDADFTIINSTDNDVKSQLEKYNCVEVCKATCVNTGAFLGYCITVEPQGFGDKIKMIVGIKPDCENYYGIKIISLAETPGLGAKAQDKEFYTQYANNKKGELTVIKNASNPTENQINAISGATITSNAVTTGANNALKIAKLLNEKEAE